LRLCATHLFDLGMTEDGGRMKRLLALLTGVGMLACSVLYGSTIPGAKYVFPLPGSRFASPQTNIIVRPQDPSVLRRLPPQPISITGALSGMHDGRAIVSDDQQTLVFNPATPFAPGEQVTVTLAGVLLGPNAHRTQYTFSVSPRPPQRYRPPVAAGRNTIGLELPTNLAALQRETMAQRDPSRAPTSQRTAPPLITVNVNTNPTEGCIYLSTFSVIDSSNPYLLVIDNNGNIVFSQERWNVCYDFKMQPNGLMTYYDASLECFVALDNNFGNVDSYRCGNGVPSTDEHELQLLNNGHALLLGRVNVPVDMSEIVEGGKPDAVIIGIVIQELDQSKNVVFQWNSWDHFDVTDAYEEVDLTAYTIDAVHTNSIDVFPDGSLLISNRNMNEVTKIDKETGDVIWRLGGKKNQFTFVGDTLPFSWQHNARCLQNGHVTVFDNGVYHEPAFSRVLEYEVDEQQMTATVVWEYIPQGTYSYYMGNAERLANGNTLIGWGGTTGASVTEVTPDGTIVWEMTLPPAVFSYRAFRFPCVASALPWTLTSSATNGRVVQKPNQSSYADGAVVSLSVVPDRGYTFVGWSGDASGNANPLLLTMDGNKTVHAECAQTHNHVSVMEGWNLVSVPVIPDDPAPNVCYPNAVSPAFAYDNGYTEVPFLRVGNGYWLKCAGENSYDIGGSLHASGDIPVVTGWNMIGPCEQEVAKADITSDPPGIVISDYYGFSDSYVLASSLTPSKGYWVKTSQAGTLHVVGAAPKLAVVQTDPSTPWATIAIQDARGRRGVLRLAPTGTKRDRYELPPLPPAGSFDVRFAGGTSVEPFGQNQYEILLRDVELPVTVTASHLQQKVFALHDGVNGSLFNARLEEGTVATILQKLEKLVLTDAGESGTLPTTYALEQNYPNPFNPLTVVNGQWPVASNVKLAVYDLLGREVKILVNERKEPGRYTFEFDGSGLASGVYMYRLTAGEYVATRKMILAK
jgi:hypothetical protein